MISLIWIAVKISVLLTIYGLVFTKLVQKSEANWVKQKLLPLTVVVFAAGLLLPSIWLYWALLALIIPIMARSASEAACLYILLMIVTPLVSRQMGVAGIYIMPFDKYLFAGIGLIVAFLMRPIKGPKRSGWFDFPIIIFLILELTDLRGLNFTSSMRVILGAATSLIIPYYFMSRSIRQAEDIKRLMFTLVFAAFVLSCEALYEWRIGFLPYELISQHLGSTLTISSYSKQRSGSLRAATSFGESTSFGLFLVIGFLSLLASRESFRNQRALILSLLVVLAGLYATNARGPLLALGLSILARDFYRRKMGAMVGKIVLLGMLALSALAMAQLSSHMADRLGLSGGSTDTVDYRKTLLRRGEEQIAKHPLLGVSPVQTYAELADLRQGEGIVDFVNAYVWYGMVAGVGGILLMLSAFYGTAIKMLEIRNRLKKVPGAFSAGGLVFCVVLFTSVSAFTTGFSNKSYFTFFVVLALGSALSPFSRTRVPTAPAKQETAPDLVATS